MLLKTTNFYYDLTGSGIFTNILGKSNFSESILWIWLEYLGASEA